MHIEVERPELLPNTRRPARVSMRFVILIAATLVALILASTLKSETAGAAPSCTDGTQASGALYRICMPQTWNGTLIMYGRGGLFPQSPLSIQDPVLIPGPPEITLSQILNSQGFAFATSSYSRSGLAILEGVDDLRDLVEIFKDDFGTPSRVIVLGFSAGGYVSILSVERHPDVYDGAIAGCAGGSLTEGIAYTGDVRAVFDYFFPNLIPGNALSVPSSVFNKWDEKYAPQIKQALLDNPDKLYQVMAVAGVAVQSGGDEVNAETLVTVLRGEVAQVDDYIQQLGGRPYDNRDVEYSGSDDDVDLNRKIHRYSIDPEAVTSLEAYEATGNLVRPLVTLYTTGDPIVPYRTAADYAAKTAGNPLHISFTFQRDGHCTFTATEIQQALVVLLANIP